MSPAISPAEVKDLRFGVATASLGLSDSHTLEQKFKALQDAGIQYCELGFGSYMAWVRARCPDLPASTCPPEWSEADEPDPSDTEIWDALYANAEDMIAYAKSFGLAVLMLQPLNQFDGWKEGSKRGEWVKRKAEKWLPLCSKLKVEQLQVGSNDYAEADASDKETAAALKWLAQLGCAQTPPVKIAYESWTFGGRALNWEKTWDLVQLGNHPNLGLCIDTAHLALGAPYGFNPLTGKGYGDSEFSALMGRLAKVPAEKIFYVELADVITPDQAKPLGAGSEFDDWQNNNPAPRGPAFVWAFCGRPVPLVGRNAGRSIENDRHLGGARVLEILEVLFKNGFRGPLMYEPFEAIHMADSDPSIPSIYAQACATSAGKFRDAFTK